MDDRFTRFSDIVGAEVARKFTAEDRAQQVAAARLRSLARRGMVEAGTANRVWREELAVQLARVGLSPCEADAPEAT